MAPLLSSISFLPLPTDTTKYEEYFLSKTDSKSSWVTRQQICGMFITIVMFVCFFKIVLWNRPATSYDRRNDPLLLQFIYTSPAAQRLPLSGQLFCWVQTTKIYHDTRALAINETWLSRCDHGQLFTGDVFPTNDIPYSTVFAGIPDSYYNLFYKSRYAFFYIYNYISKDFDWYMKADDDTYVVVEHLRDYLHMLDPNKPYYLGYTLKPYLKYGYNAGGAGYVLSRAAVEIFNQELYKNETMCPDDIYEDVGIGRCLASVGIFPHDTRNSRGQNRFNTFGPSEVFHATKSDPKWTFFSEKKGYEAFANDFISFHHLTPDEIRLFDILLYRTNRPSSKHLKNPS
ncbi:N-acetyllactosaminide 3-alpha-galactosyltransferase [Dictyocaulus viviparus]|uniref:N-acetylgalactosaminide beta-1,3-galactosyltransferase n=1 Tax=Dictyocaulus viviparus TaxID=29172 RepID=A0A0D8Y5X2_DICVI|nr:N-acetyllactosaminide 3-alpha-galactosyltransferase [Dictyocaulus viviparus]